MGWDDFLAAIKSGQSGGQGTGAAQASQKYLESIRGGADDPQPVNPAHFDAATQAQAAQLNKQWQAKRDGTSTGLPAPGAASVSQED
jgi:hypothetical protein